jgi:hypothetical protein
MGRRTEETRRKEMSILINGMEMPKNCMLCPFCVEEADPANGEMCMVTGKLMPPCNRERLDDCPLSPVPPHDDLIDRAALRAEVKKHATPSDAWVFNLIRTASTIIPAEEEAP